MSGPGCKLESFIRTFSFLFFFSLVIPQFGLLSHVSSLRLSTGHSGPILTLSTDDAARTSLPSPRLLVADVSVWANSPLAVEIRCVVYVFFFFFLMVMLPCNILKLPADLPVRGFPSMETSFTTSSQGWVSVPNSCLFLSFIFCPAAKSF